MNRTSEEQECCAERPTLLVVDAGLVDMDLLIAVMLLAGVKKAGLLRPDGKFEALI